MSTYKLVGTVFLSSVISKWVELSYRGKKKNIYLSASNGSGSGFQVKTNRRRRRFGLGLYPFKSHTHSNI